MEGYITVAFDLPKYVDMAVRFAQSARYFDPERRICLVHNEKVSLPGRYEGLFDDVILLPTVAGYVGCMNKIRLNAVTPYERTMYVDADCLLVKNDIGRYWQRLAGTPFTMTGTKRSAGRWNNLDFAGTCAFFGIPYVVQMNSGVFYFEKGRDSDRFFETLHALYRDHRDSLSNIHQGRAGQYADEPLFGTAMGMFGIEPFSGFDDGGSWMITTWRARRCAFRPEANLSRIDKPTGYWFDLPLVAKGWVRHSPTIAHFIGLKPRPLYDATAAFFAARWEGDPRTAPLQTRAVRA